MTFRNIRIGIIVMGMLLILFLSGMDRFLAAEENGDGPGVFNFDRFLIDRVPGGDLYPFFIENYVPDATFLIEENNGFSLIDNPRVYFEGDSYLNFNWHYNGIKMNSWLNDGTPGVILPFGSVSSFGMEGESLLNQTYGINFISGDENRSESRLKLSNVFPNMGGYWATFLIQPSHPKERAKRLYTERRRIHSNYSLDYTYNKKLSKGFLQAGVSYVNLDRQFNDFNVFNHTYLEKGKMFLSNIRYRKTIGEPNSKTNNYYELFGVLNYLDRDNQGAETGSYPQETIGKERFSIFTGVVWNVNRLHGDLSLLWEHEKLTPFTPNFSKDIMDNDGDSIYPYGKSGEDKMGTFSSPTVSFNVKYGLTGEQKKVNVDSFAELRYSGINGDETVHNFNPILFDKNPYQVVLWKGGESYSNSNMQAKFGVNVAIDLTESIELLGKVYYHYQALNFDGSTNGDSINASKNSVIKVKDSNDMNFGRPGFDAGIRLFKNKKTNLLFSFGIEPYDIRENVNFFLESGRPSGTIYEWNDKNGDKTFQVGEEAAVFGYTGSAYRYVDRDIKAPMKQRLLLYFTTPISKNFTLNVKGLYKKMKDMFRVKFAEGENVYGHYETVNGNQLFIFDQPAKDYVLTNGGYEKDPFYAEFMFEIKGRKPGKWFLSFSFMAHMGMGNTAFGNGPGSNDIGILNESQANPNAWLNGFGRVDGDRGFVAKSYFGYYITRKLFAAVSFKYRDGDPFAFLNSFSRNNQWVIYYKTIKGEDEKGKKGGPREDYVGDLSFNLSTDFKLFNGKALISLGVYNILDVGTELSEYVFSGGDRDSVELQLPRSVRLSIGWTF